MDSKGIIRPIRTVSCDGGSTLTIDYKTTFVTQTGMVAQYTASSVDVSDVKVGDTVTARYVTRNGVKSLDCNGCSILPVK